MTGMAVQPPGHPVGRFQVHASPAEASAFRQALGVTGTGTGPGLPLTYPVRWLALPEVRAAVQQALGGATGTGQPGEAPPGVLVHLQQRFTYASPLQAGARYAMALYLEADAQLDSFAVHAEILSDDRLCCRAEGRFALVAQAIAPQKSATMGTR